MASFERESFFTVPFEHLRLERQIDFDLYINSSVISERERFVKIFPLGDIFSQEDLQAFKEKYHQIYIREDQRDLYLRSLVSSAEFPIQTKTEVIRESAIHHLNNIFDQTREFSTEVLQESLEGCRDTVENMVEVIHDKSVKDVQSLIAELSYHDFYTYDHSINVSMYCISIFKAYKPEASKEDLIEAGLGGLLHDLGKIKIPTSIINNPGKLSDEDFEQIKQHPSFGKDLLLNKGCTSCGIDPQNISRVIFEHHENWDGTGYPSKVKGEEIHLLARITAIADFFDAITTKRSYHEVVNTDEAIAIMANSVGRKLDPELFEIFARNCNALIKNRHQTRALDDSFDPCQPTNILPFIEVKPKYLQENILEQKETSDFGSVTLDDGSLLKKKKNKKQA